MPRRDDIKRIMIVGSGPIVIGQAAEFDYAGAQACKVLRAEGYEVVLVNSNPATIMTDPEFAERTYIEPLTPKAVTAIIDRERPDALLPTLGGQTALNLAKALYEDGTLARYDVELIGASYEAICRGEDREEFRAAMSAAGLRCAHSLIATSVAQAEQAIKEIGLPLIVRPAFTLGGAGGGVASTRAQLRRIVSAGLQASPTGQVLVEESLLGFGEFELELMRDRNDNVVVVCSIENVDPMGVHTGDSVTVAPQQTLPDRLYQRLRDQAIAVIRAVGVETGGSNVQFAVNPATEEVVVIEMNPRVSRSSALASKATGFPIAKIAARLAVGYALDEISNDITQVTPASFEPALDYVVVKIPRFAFEKFRGADGRLSTQMQSVGEAMAFGATFTEAFEKALQSRELDSRPNVAGTRKQLLQRLQSPSSDRYDVLLAALRAGASAQEVSEASSIDPWFCSQFERLAAGPPPGEPELTTFRAVDTCAAEFAAQTPYFYGARERGERSHPRHELSRDQREAVVILGSGPNRIGQGIEFDYCCVHAAQAVRESGRAAVMVNCNPETVSTDYDSSDRLYFEPLTLESVLAVCEVERPVGVIVQFGGQTPLRLAAALEAAGVPLLSASAQRIAACEDRGTFAALLERLGYRAPRYASAADPAGALAGAEEVGFPLLVRPSFVLGGRSMEIVYSRAQLEDYLERTPVRGAIYLDHFLENAVEVDVDALCDGERAWAGAVMQHVEEAGVHSGDSACCLPPHSLASETLDAISAQTRGLALALGVVGLLNVQFAVTPDGEVYVIEANPRASRTVPFASKALGVPLAKLATRLLLGERLSDLGLPPERPRSHRVAVKAAVLPFQRFLGADSLLSPEMRSTGEVMGSGRNFPEAFAKAMEAVGGPLPDCGTVALTVSDRHKEAAAGVALALSELGFKLAATRGTARTIARFGLPVSSLKKLPQGEPNIVSEIEAGRISLVVNTPTGEGARCDGVPIRAAALRHGVPCITTIAGAVAACRAIRAQRDGGPAPISLQEMHARRR